jgi:hypothetical protein
MGEEEGSVWYEKTFTVFFPFKFFFNYLQKNGERKGDGG